MTAPESAVYIGRFAPSPTGPLHFGSLLAAMASYLQARVNDGRWLLRIEDIDPPRQQEGAEHLIIATLGQYGFEWDGPVTFQSHNNSLHQEALAGLLRRQLAYRCSCSRRDLAKCPIGPLGPIYPGTCRCGCQPGNTAIRVRTHAQRIDFDDGLQGLCGQSVERESGDFVIWRRDGLVAYHLAVVVDDADQGVTEIVRGLDLLESTPRQIHLQQLLNYPTPAYMHIPLAVNAEGQKLSKLTGASGIPQEAAGPILVTALALLRQQPPPGLADCRLPEIWQWAIDHWRPQVLTGLKTIQGGQDAMLQRENRLR